MRDESFLVLARRHGEGPEAGGLHCQSAVGGVFWGHGFGEVEGFEDKGPVDHVAGVVEAGAEVAGYDVEVVAVGGRVVVVFYGEEGRGLASGEWVCVGEAVHVGVGPLESLGKVCSPGLELAG